MRSFFLLFILSFSYCFSEELNRLETDPKVTVTTGFLVPERVDLFIKEFDASKLEDQRTPPVFRRLWGKSDVFLVHAVSQQKPGSADFSQITTNTKGTLTLYVKNHPNGDVICKVSKPNQVLFEKTLMNNNKWERIEVPFDHEAIKLESIANGWYFEHLFVTYSIETE